MMQMASSNTIVESIVDDQKGGRVMSLFVMARRRIESLGSLFFGVIANWIDTPRTLIIGGGFSVLAVAAFASNLRSIRQEMRTVDNHSKRQKKA